MRLPEFAPAHAEWLRKLSRWLAQAIEAGAQRVEVTAPTPEQWRANGGM